MPENGLQNLKYPKAGLEQLCKTLDEYISAAEAFRAASWSTDHAVHQRMYECLPSNPSPTWPWRGAAAYFFPLGRAAADAHASQEHDALWTNDPFVKVTGTESDDLYDAEQLSIYYGEFLYKNVIPMRLLGGDYTMNNAIDGTTMLIPTWERRMTTRIENVITTEPIYKTIQQDFLGVSTSTRQITGYKDTSEEQFIVEPLDRPNLIVGDVDKLFMSPDTGTSLYAEDCPWYYIQNQWTLSDLRDRRRRGYDFGSDEDFETIKARLTQRELTPKEKVKRQADKLSETESGDSLKALEFFMPLVLPGQYHVGDEITSQQWDDDDGHSIECIVTYLPTERRIVRIVPTQRIYPDGKRAHILSQWVRRHNHPYGMGIMARCRQMNKWMNQLGNQFVDRGSLETLPFALYNPATTGLLPDMMGIQPGQFIPVSGDPRGVYQPRMQSGSADFFQAAMNVALSWNERDTTVNDFNLGRGRSSSSGTNTARGQAMMMQAGSLMFSRLTSQHSEPLSEAYRRIHELHRKYSKDQIFKVTGIDSNRLQNFRIPQRAFQQDINIEFVINPNRTYEQQVNERLVQFMSKIPQVANNPQGMRELVKDYYESYGKKNFKNIWPQITVQAQQQQQRAVEAAQGLPPQPMLGGQSGQLGAPQPGAQQAPGQPMLPGATNVLPFPQPPPEQPHGEADRPQEIPPETDDSVRLMA